MRSASRVMLATAIALGGVVAPSVLGQDSASGNTSDENGYRYYRSGRWIIWKTDDFRVCTLDSRLNLNALPARCEQLKTQIESAWCAGKKQAWDPRCDVIVHTTLSNYQQALGRGVGDSVGCATIQYENDRVVSRRIDIRADAETWQIDALPHELAHIVIASGYGNRRLPPWLDEGIGVLSESNPKRQLRISAFDDARRRRTVYSTAELANLRTFPNPEYRDAFYVQSAALVRLLVDRSGPDEFARFADLVLSSSFERALQETYGIAGVSELDRIVRKTDVASLVSRGGTLQKTATLVVKAED